MNGGNTLKNGGLRIQIERRSPYYHISELYQMPDGKTGLAGMLEMKLRRNLEKSRTDVRRHDSKPWRTKGPKTRRSNTRERGVVERVESFKSQLETLCFRQLCILQQRHVPVVQAWAVEKSASRVSDRSHSLSTEQARIEIRSALPRVRRGENLAAAEVGQVDWRFGSLRAGERSVVGFRQSDWKPGSESRDTGEGPTPRELVAPTCSGVQGSI